MKFSNHALAFGLLASVSPSFISAGSSSSSTIGDSGASRMQRLTRRIIDLSSGNSAAGSPVQRWNATTLIVHEDRVANTVSNTTTTIGQVTSQQKKQESFGSPYNVVQGLKLAVQFESDPVKRGDDMHATEGNGDIDEDEDCEEEEEDEDEDEDDEECEEDGDDNDDEQCEEGSEGDEEDCEDDEDDDSESPVDDAVGFVSTKPGSTGSAATPENLAKGSLKGEEGCTKFTTASSGDTCYKLIGAKDDTLLKTFYKNNPSVDSGCQNLEVGTAYCVSSAELASTIPINNVKVEEPKQEAPKQESAAPAAPAPTPKQEQPKIEESEKAEPARNEVKPVVAVDASVNVPAPAAPQPSPKKEEPKPAPAPAQEPKKEAAPAPSQYSGFATYYYQYGNAGACGHKRGDGDYIVALHPSLYQNGAKCGDKISLSNSKTGKTITAIVEDLCPSCEKSTHVDLSDGAFKAISNGADGKFDINFSFI